MEHLFVNAGGINIAYIERNTERENTIFFIHGNSVSKRNWRKQYNSDILRDFRMVAIDLPAHGDSEVADVKNYTLPGLAKIMLDAVRQLANGKPYILAGISLSTNIIAEMLAYDIQPKGLVLAGPCVFGKDHPIEKLLKPDTHAGVVFADEPDEADVYQYGKQTSLSRDMEDINIFREDFKIVKSPFRSLFAQSITSAAYSDEVALLKKENIPSLVVFGKDELVINTDYLDDASLPLWNNTIYKIEGASHLVNIDQPGTFNELLRDFANEIFK